MICMALPPLCRRWQCWTLPAKTHEAALPKLLKSLELLQKTGDRTGEAVALFDLGNLYMDKGEFQLAKEDFEKALLLEREIGNRSGEAAVLHSLGSDRIASRCQGDCLGEFQRSTASISRTRLINRVRPGLSSNWVHWRFRWTKSQKA